MKKILFLLLCVSVVSFADVTLYYVDDSQQTSSQQTTPQQTNPLQTNSQQVFSQQTNSQPSAFQQEQPSSSSWTGRSSFYASFSLGMDYTRYRDNGDFEFPFSKGTYRGKGLVMDTKVGLLIKGLVGPFGSLLFSKNYGDLKNNGVVQSDVEHYRFGFDVGVIGYPFRNSHGFVDGLFFSASMGRDLAWLNYGPIEGKYDSSEQDVGGLFWQFEVGKDFNGGNRFNIGVALVYTLGFVVVSEDSGEDSYGADIRTVGLVIHFSRI